MPFHKALYYYLWIAPHVLQIVLVLLMIRRRLVREFPVFFGYTMYEIFQFIILFVVAQLHFMHLYGTLFYGGEVISAALRFAIIYQIFAKVFKNYSSLKRMDKSFFHWATVILMVAAVLIVAYTPSLQTDPTVIIMNTVDRTISIVQCGLLLSLLALSHFLKFSWRSYAFGIALGVGIYDGLKLLDWAIADRFGGIGTADIFTMFLMAAYHCCVLFWLVTLLLPQTQMTLVSNVSSANLDRWNDTLERFLQS